MKKVFIFPGILLVAFNFLPLRSIAHPASGIVVDHEGNIYFIYSRGGVFKIDTKGHVSKIKKISDGHWMVLDEKEYFKGTHPKYFQSFPATANNAAILFAGGGSPVALDPKGNFYYCGSGENDENPGALSLMKETNDGKIINAAPGLTKILNGFNDGITGLVVGADGSVYVACWNSLLKVSPTGSVSVLLHPVQIKECDEDPADHLSQNRGIPLLRGIDVDNNGNIYAAATSCHCVIKISPQKVVKTILKSPRPWSPTGVAVKDGNIYILEYSNANGPATEGWVPRIKKIDNAGKVTILGELAKLN